MPSVNGHQFIEGYPAVAKAMSEAPLELLKDMSLKPSLRAVRDATVRLMQANRARDIELSNRVAIENQSTEYKAVNGMGELQCRIPLSVFIEQKQIYGDDWPGSQKAMDEFLRDNPQYKVKISRGTRGQSYEGQG